MTETNMTDKEAMVWTYILAHRDEGAAEVAAATGTGQEFVEQLLARVGTPDHVWRSDTSRRIKNEGKPRYDLIPPELLEAVASVLSIHAGDKYEARGWERGIDWGDLFASLQRHLWAWMGGEDIDPQSGRPHLDHAAARMAMLVASTRRGIGADDRPAQEDEV